MEEKNTITNPPDSEYGEFPGGKDNYCPRCYFEDEITVSKSICKHSKLITPN